jgi:hypothetical protein
LFPARMWPWPPAQRRNPLPAQARKARGRSAPRPGAQFIDADYSAAFVDAVEYVAPVPRRWSSWGGRGAPVSPGMGPPFSRKIRKGRRATAPARYCLEIGMASLPLHVHIRLDQLDTEVPRQTGKLQDVLSKREQICSS